jgi:hypothetical protein
MELTRAPRRWAAADGHRQFVVTLLSFSVAFATAVRLTISASILHELTMNR